MPPKQQAKVVEEPLVVEKPIVYQNKLSSTDLGHLSSDCMASVSHVIDNLFDCFEMHYKNIIINQTKVPFACKQIVIFTQCTNQIYNYKCCRDKI